MDQYRYEEDKPLSDELASAIGQMVQQWGHLEDNASILTAMLLRTNHYAFRSVATNVATRSKFDALAAVAMETMTKRKAATIVTIAKKAISLSAERNRIIHGSWYPTAKPAIAERYSYSAGRDAGLKQSHETISAARVRGFTAEIVKLRRRFNHALSREGFYRHGSWPRASP
jgi:hypothetical protein